MNEYDLGQMLYYFEYPNNVPQLITFTVQAIRQTDAGYTYANLDSPSAPYLPESMLFETIKLAVAAGVAALESFLPPP